MCLCTPSSIIWYRSKGGDALRLEGNRRSGIALAMHHGLSGLSTYRLNGQRIEDEHPAYAPNGARPGLPLTGFVRHLHVVFQETDSSSLPSYPQSVMTIHSKILAMMQLLSPASLVPNIKGNKYEGHTVFRGLRNFKPSHGICPIPRNFDISAEFRRS